MRRCRSTVELRAADLETPGLYVKAHPSDPMEVFPNFMVVGPQRTGTTWLHYNLSQHPQVFMSRKKEIYFFNLLNKPDHPKYRSSDLAWYLRHFNPGLFHRIERQVWCISRWRRRCSVQVRGEATASYAAMEPELIDEIVRLQPDMKAIIMVRNPVTRAWSHAIKDLVKRPKRKAREITEAEWLDYFTDPYQLACGRYSRIIDNWTERLGAERVFVGRFEDIAERPQELLKGLLSFLGVEAGDAMTGRADTKINAGVRNDIPDDLRAKLGELFARELRELNSRFGWEYPV